MWDAKLGPENPIYFEGGTNQPINSSCFHEGLLANILGNSCLQHHPKKRRKPGGKLKLKWMNPLLSR